MGGRVHTYFRFFFLEFILGLFFSDYIRNIVSKCSIGIYFRNSFQIFFFWNSLSPGVDSIIAKKTKQRLKQTT
eukprot:NODE_8179_length_368_cov_50.369906_g6442_i0.p1 GENE.NODE_8179_length_368_cov_50.369906_g6442_i0~~NODE_8179_length_368_cov_50.369906_g6442_i0.p1  ORF type:complete len:80 (+),score=11.00 NODE_8179_length_368_cov_50.369906_g6442_i0:23-241(+)